jgi:hypothetical protein
LKPVVVCFGSSSREPIAGQGRTSGCFESYRRSARQSSKHFLQQLFKIKMRRTKQNGYRYWKIGIDA